MSISNLRTEYERTSLLEEDAGDDPVVLFHRWFEEALRAGVREPNAMTLATSSAQGRPSARIVLCKEYDERGFTFYTNRQSAKGEDLAANPLACLLFFWAELERQVRITGAVTLVADSESDAYFAQRPRAAQVGAWASPQSRAIADRASLERALEDAAARHADASSLPRPPHWGGYRLAPESVEFWQGRPSRLHDRLLYARRGSAWLRQRLAP